MQSIPIQRLMLDTPLSIFENIQNNSTELDIILDKSLKGSLYKKLLLDLDSSLWRRIDLLINLEEI